MIVNSQFKPIWWLSNPHGQTIFPVLTRTIQAKIDDNERLELPDGDFIDLAWSKAGLSDDSPLVIILHGLGGNVQSKYVGGFMQSFNRLGWRAVLMHFRGASEEPNRLPRVYHSGETSDLDYVIEFLAKREPNSTKAIVGVSLGGNVLLKWLGERGKSKKTAKIKAAVAISVPLELSKVADRVNKGFSKVYQIYLLRKLKEVFIRKFKNTPQYDEISVHIKNKKCFWTFDENVTAPLSGFESVHAYYRKCSSRQYLKSIKLPTLIIQSIDDPFMSPDILPREDELSDSVTLELSQKGGHVGFISGDKTGKPYYWLEKRIPEFLNSFLGELNS